MSGTAKHELPTGERPMAVSRRSLLAGGAGATVAASMYGTAALSGEPEIDLAQHAVASSSVVAGHASVDTILLPRALTSSRDGAGARWSSWPSSDDEWIELRWPEPVTIGAVEFYWSIDGGAVRPPARVRLSRWTGSSFAPVVSDHDVGLDLDTGNRLSFAPVTTERLRIDLTPRPRKSIGLLRWRAIASGAVPPLPPAVDAGIDRAVMLNGETYLKGRAGWAEKGPGDTLRWSRKIGPGAVLFADPTVAETAARFSRPGDYVLNLTATATGRTASSDVHVRVAVPPPAKRLDVVYTTPYAVDSPFWTPRFRALVVNWIPHCIAYCERTDLRIGDGGIDNFIEAAKALRGEPHARHRGFVFSNAWVHQTIESICLALMIDPQGDVEMIAAQSAMRATLDRWIPIVLSAQHPDGYLHTAYTLADRTEWPERWSAAHRGDHEGYVAGYFIEAAINHYTLTNGADRRLYEAARRLADCWVANIGPDGKVWFDGHQEMEQALVRFGRFVNDVERDDSGDAYVALAKFLLDSRSGGSRYDQSHLPAVQQYEAVGHAVRAVYFYSGMADVAAETGDVDYQSAVASLWQSMVDRKYYVTGGVGSGDTAEGFGEDYGLRHDAYCESCSSCGFVFFQYKMNIAYHDARYADLYEETLYNALLGGIALDGESFCYTNPLIGTERARWHACPCCVGNIPRTLLMLPTWTYAKGDNALFVNLFVGGRTEVGEIAGVTVTVRQDTDYPWDGRVSITLEPALPRRFALHVRAPDRRTSGLYDAKPAVAGLRRLTVNGRAARYAVRNGYAVVERMWRAGDSVAFELPLDTQRVRAVDEVAATREQTALRRGPLVYSVERADRQDISKRLGEADLRAVWKPDLLGGIVALEGAWSDGSKLTAVPYYGRMNRTGRAPAEFPKSDIGLGGEQVADATSLSEPAPDTLSRVWLRTDAPPS